MTRPFMWNGLGSIVAFAACLAALYVGFFHNDTVCDDQAHLDWACHSQAAFTNELGFLIAGGFFFLLALWMLYRTVRKVNVT